MKNLYETRRMQYTIYNALGGEPSTWKNGKPLATIHLAIPADLDSYTASMWPWHASDLEELVGYESFRDGFILGVRLMMEVTCGQGRFSENA